MPTAVPIHLVQHEVVGPAEHDGAGRLRLGALEENQLAIADALFRNLPTFFFDFKKRKRVVLSRRCRENIGFGLVALY